MRSLATGASSFTTFVQVLPRLPSLLARMRPTWHLPSLAALDEQFLRSNGIRGIIWDVDGTLTGDRRSTLEPQVEGSFRSLLRNPDLRHVILSNSGEERFRQLGEIFPEVPLLRAYRLRGEVLYRRRLGGTDNWSAEELESRLAQGAVVVRKPDAQLIDYCVRELGVGADATVMVGDQYLTDVAGANLGGVRSVKLATLAPDTFRRTVRFSQVVELGLYRLLYGAPR